LRRGGDHLTRRGRRRRGGSSSPRISAAQRGVDDSRIERAPVLRSSRQDERRAHRKAGLGLGRTREGGEKNGTENEERKRRTENLYAPGDAPSARTADRTDDLVAIVTPPRRGRWRAHRDPVSSCRS
jgi:hypothetical protein